MAVTLVWEDPPPLPGAGSRPPTASETETLVAQLKAKAGRWAVWPLDDNAATLRRLGLEAAMRMVDGEVRVYVRWPAPAVSGKKTAAKAAAARKK